MVDGSSPPNNVETGSVASKGSNMSKLSEHSMNGGGDDATISGMSSAGTSAVHLPGVNDPASSLFLRRVRIFILMCLAILAAVSAGFSFILKSNEEEQDFELQVRGLSLCVRLSLSPCHAMLVSNIYM